MLRPVANQSPLCRKQTSQQEHPSLGWSNVFVFCQPSDLVPSHLLCLVQNCTGQFGPLCGILPLLWERSQIQTGVMTETMRQIPRMTGPQRLPVSSQHLNNSAVTLNGLLKHKDGMWWTLKGGGGWRVGGEWRGWSPVKAASCSEGSIISCRRSNDF